MHSYINAHTESDKVMYTQEKKNMPKYLNTTFIQTSPLVKVKTEGNLNYFHNV